jgi:hypothetical protein
LVRLVLVIGRHVVHDRVELLREVVEMSSTGYGAMWVFGLGERLVSATGSPVLSRFSGSRI